MSNVVKMESTQLSAMSEADMLQRTIYAEALATIEWRFEVANLAERSLKDLYTILLTMIDVGIIVPDSDISDALKRAKNALSKAKKQPEAP